MGEYWQESRESIAEMHLHEALGNLARMGLDTIIEFKKFVSNINIDVARLGSLYQQLRGKKQRVEDTKVLVMEYLVRLGAAINNRDVYADVALSLDRSIQLADGAAYRLYMFVENGFNTDVDIHNDIKAFVEKLVEEYRLLYDGIMKLRVDPKQSLKIMEKIIKIEDELDGMYREIELKLFKKLSNNIAALMLLKEAIDFIEDISDVVKEAGEAVRYIALHRTVIT
ncbi:DUF47 family protein [Desulfurococcaceae archaeon MEX13E-LK6-19]|nr:DUF47 family protein [Desulfurococcaceae archaeon MEX13E-LK6-19]